MLSVQSFDKSHFILFRHQLGEGLITATGYRVAPGAKWMDKGAFKALMGATHGCNSLVHKLLRHIT